MRSAAADGRPVMPQDLDVARTARRLDRDDVDPDAAGREAGSVRQVRAARQPRRRPPGASGACASRRSPRAGRSRGSPRQRTSTRTSIGGGLGSTARMSTSARPRRRLRARIVQPSATRCASTIASPRSPRRCAGVLRRIVDSMRAVSSEALIGGLSARFSGGDRCAPAPGAERSRSSSRGQPGTRSRNDAVPPARPSDARSSASANASRTSRPRRPRSREVPASAARRRSSRERRGRTADGTVSGP